MEALSQILLLLFGLGVFAAFYGSMLYRTAFRWRNLAEFYERPWRETPAKRHLQSATFYGNGVALNTYNGIVTLGVHPDGLALKLLDPFSAFHPPLFVPYDEIKGHKQNWYLNSKAYELEFRQFQDIKIVMPADQVDWIQSSSGGQLDLDEQLPDHKERPDVSRALMVTVGLLGAATGLIILVQQLLGS